MPHTERIASILQIFAVRAAAEIERTRAEQALRESEASYRAIFEAAEDAIFVHDWDTGAIVDVNPKACEAFGYAHEEMCGISVGQISLAFLPPGRKGRRGRSQAGRTVELEGTPNGRQPALGRGASEERRDRRIPTCSRHPEITERNC
jgi:PAS domain-containing protein